MNLIKNYIKNLFSNTESIDCSARKEEMIDGKAFTYKQYPIKELKVYPSDTMKATVTSSYEDGTSEEISVSEEIGKFMTIDTVSIFRAKEAFGMTDCIGAAFGKKK